MSSQKRADAIKFRHTTDSMPRAEWIIRDDIADAIDAAVAEEREAIAHMVETMIGVDAELPDIAAAIRNRSKT